MTKRPQQFLTWAEKTFGSVARSPIERVSRFFEEAAELAQAVGMTRAMADALLDRVYSRPAGAVRKELGQAAATLETFAENAGMCVRVEAQHEWERVQAIPQTEWDRRHKAKVDKGLANIAERLVGSAIIRGEEMKTWTEGGHYNIRAAWGDDDPTKTKPGDREGFVTSTGRFVSRAEAQDVAVASGQLRSKMGRPLLSSDLNW